jgi:hypothetical protein
VKRQTQGELLARIDENVAHIQEDMAQLNGQVQANTHWRLRSQGVMLALGVLGVTALTIALAAAGFIG